MSLVDLLSFLNIISGMMFFGFCIVRMSKDDFYFNHEGNYMTIFKSFLNKLLVFIDKYPIFYVAPILWELIPEVVKIKDPKTMCTYFLIIVAAVFFPALAIRYVKENSGKLILSDKILICITSCAFIGLYAWITGFSRLKSVSDYEDSFVLNSLLEIIPNWLGYTIFGLYLLFPAVCVLRLYYRIWKK